MYDMICNSMFISDRILHHRPDQLDNVTKVMITAEIGMTKGELQLIYWYT